MVYMESLKPLIAYVVHGDCVLLGIRERGNYFLFRLAIV